MKLILNVNASCNRVVVICFIVCICEGVNVQLKLSLK